LIFLKDVAKFFSGHPLFQNVNISVHRGDRVGFVGPNGAGKSTILGLMEGVLSPDEGEISIEKRIRMGILHQELVQGNDGSILEEVMDISEELRGIRRRLEVSQEKMGNLTQDNAEADSIIAEHGRLQQEFERYQGYTLEARARKVLQGLGFSVEDAQRRWGEFSGGWRMRVALAKILLAEPDVLLLDEPTNHLDLESLLWVEDYLREFKGALVLASHDRSFLNRLVDRIVEVEGGKATSYTGNYDTYEKTRRMQEDVQLAAYKNQQDKRKHIQKFIDQSRVKARTASRVQSRIKMLEKMETIEPPKMSRSVKFRFPQPPASGRRAIEIKGLVKRFDELVVYDGLDLALDRGDRIGLVGPNGAGKSTLMKIMAGILPHEGGTVKYGHKVKIGYFAQHQSEGLNSEISVIEEAISVSPGLTEQEVRNLLGAFLFSGDDVYKKVRVLSGGEKSRLALTKILLAPPNLLLMDEPTNHLDIPSCEILEQAMEQFQGTLVLITHDRRLMNRICTNILEIDGGNADLFLGNYDDYRYKRALMEKESDQSPAPKIQPSIPETEPDINKESRKNRKRREAQARIALSRKMAPIRTEIEKVEQELQSKEARKREIETIMADPANYEDKGLMLPLLEEEPVVSKDIKNLEARWEELQIKLEEMENGALEI